MKVLPLCLKHMLYQVEGIKILTLSILTSLIHGKKLKKLSENNDFKLSEPMYYEKCDNWWIMFSIRYSRLFWMYC